MPTGLSADEILSCPDLPLEFVPTPEWAGGKPDCGVWIRGLSGEERDAWEAGNFILVGKKPVFNAHNLRARLCAKVICDAQGTRLFSEEQVLALGKKHSGPLDRIYERARALSGLRAEDVDDAEKA